MDANRPIIPAEEQFKIMADTAPVLIWISGIDKLYYFFNAGWLRFTGRTMEQEYGNGWAGGIHPDDLQRRTEIYTSSFDARRDFKIKYRLKRHDGQYRWLLDHGVPRYDTEGNFAGYTGSCTDIDELLASERMRSDHISAEALYLEHELNEELAAANEEMASANEELTATNEELVQAQDSLAALNNQLEDIVAFRTRELSKSESRFRFLIKGAPVAIGVLKNRELVIESANEMLLKLWGKSKEIIGKELYTAIPELKGQLFLQLLDDVYVTGETYFGNEVKVMLEHNGQLEEFYFNFIYKPLKDKEGTTDTIMMVAVDVTELVISRKGVEHSRHRLNSMIMTAPIGMTVLHGPELIIEIVNQPMLNMWNRKTADVLNKPLIDVFPELKDQPFPKMLATVFDTGKSVAMPEIEVIVSTPEGSLHHIVDFSYDPLFDAEGKVEAILATVINITEVVNARKKLEQSEEDEQALNEKLRATNEELATVNEELLKSQSSLELNLQRLAESEARFRSIITQAPVGICVIRAKDLMVMEVNDGYLELVGKKRDELEHLTIWEAVPEAANNYAPVMDEVVRTGVPFVAKEHEVWLIRNGMPERLFIDFVYEPLKDADGIVSIVMVVGIEITAQVLARQNIADVEERIRLAVEAAEIGTFDHDLRTDEMVTSEKFNAIFGFDHPASRAQILEVIHPDDRAVTAALREEAYKTGKMFYDARLVHKDGTIHWIRANGKVYFDSDRKPLRVLGTILDITEFKRLQQQKDDFISIASHELKTPITSLKASLQLLERLKDKPETPVVRRLIEQSNKSMVKISELVEDLLNVSRMSEGQIQLNKSTFNIAHMLNECCNHVRVAGKHELIFHGDQNLEIFADEQRIDQVVVNFVNNAVKYAPDSREIYLLVEERGDSVWIAVKDSGSGVPAEKLPHLFDRYYRADESGFQVSGLGLGLYISAEIIKRHGGQIGVDSELGKGSTFWFTLPH